MSDILGLAVEVYASEILEQLQSAQAREHGYRPALERLMRSFGDTGATNDPKRSAHGNPDMIFYKKSNHDVILGYAEAKDIDVSLDKTAKTEQLHRYAGYNKLFLTNYLEFRFYKNGEEYERITIGKLRGQTIDFDRSQFSRLANELQAFLQLPPEPIKSGKSLALIMGQKARRIRDSLAFFIERGGEKNQELEKIYEMMKKLLVHDLYKEKFADMYAQTLVYGLFAARYNDKTPDDFTRQEAGELVPASNPFLREFFAHIGGIHFDKRLAVVVDELCEVFAVSDVGLLVQKHLRLFEVENEKDPIIHFYEDFLKEYDPAERKRMGAYYTPIPVVKFIIREVDRILKEDFGLSKGLADTSKIVKEIDHGQQLHIRNPKTGRLEKTSVEKREFHKVQVLDPAVGTATFLNETIKFIAKSFEGQEGRWPAYVESDLLPRLSGFELMMAPYTIAHLKLAMTLAETGVKDLHGKRLGVYLTNTLEEGIPRQQDLFSIGLAAAVTEESQKASEIKHDRPIMIVMGNPPYSASSSNRTDYANNSVKKYKVEPGGQQKLQEHKHWLNDDYVKFLSFAEDMVERNGTGIVAMITNNGYLDNPTFRGMRWHLARTFDKIYVLDLHGNAKKKEVSPDGTKDENVFDIMQGVSIVVAVKSSRDETLADVYHTELWGTRRRKFSELVSGRIDFEKLKLDQGNVFFVPQNTAGMDEYRKNIAVDDLFANRYLTGVVSGNDKVTLFDTGEECEKFVQWCRMATDQELEAAWGKFGRGQTAQKIREDVNNPNGKVVRISYRPFEVKWTWYSGMACGFLFRPRRKEIMGSMIPYFSTSAEKDISFLADFSASPNTSYWNIGLVTTRLQKDNPGAFIFADGIIGHKTFNAYDSNSIFPLYTYHSDGSRTSNFNPSELPALTRNLTIDYSPEDILDYIYAVLHSPKYREKYKEFLKADFPRVPAPADDAEFMRLSDLGKQLRELHLMKSPLLETYGTTFPETGSNEVERATYANGNVWINDKQYFGNVPESAWNFYIGGYQPAQKYLKDRRARKLTNIELDHYQRILKILDKTAKIMKEIDEA